MVGPTPQHWANREELEMQYTTRIKATSISSLQRSIGRNLSLPLLTCPSMIGPGRSRFHIPIHCPWTIYPDHTRPTGSDPMRPDEARSRLLGSAPATAAPSFGRGGFVARQLPGSLRTKTKPPQVLPWSGFAISVASKRKIGGVLRGNPVRSSNRVRPRSGRWRRSHEALAAVRYHRTGAVTA